MPCKWTGRGPSILRSMRSTSCRTMWLTTGVFMHRLSRFEFAVVPLWLHGVPAVQHKFLTATARQLGQLAKQDDYACFVM